MDRFYSAAEVARELGTNVPRVLRTADRLGLKVRRVPRGQGARFALTRAQLERLRAQLGVVDSAPNLSRVDIQVLAALARAPRGVLSARSVARRAGISPTAAANALTRLVSRRLVLKERERAALGRACEVDVYHANVTAPEWSTLAPHLARVRPATTRRQAAPARRVPPELRHLFWNTAPDQLDVERAGGYIARRLIQSGDLDGLAWGAEHLGRHDWNHAADTRGLAPDLRALALNLADASGE